jgi:cation transport ATPase
MAITYQVRHAIPGRIRLQVPFLKNNERLAQSCTQFLEAEEGVTKVRINPWAESVLIEYDPGKGDILNKLRNAMGVVTPILSTQTPVFPVAPKNTERAKAKELQPPVTQNCGTGSLALRPLVLPTATLGLSLFGGPLGTALILPLLGYNVFPILKRAFNVLRYEHRLNVDFLDSLAIIISTLRGSLFTSTFMTWLINLGDFIRDRTAAKSRCAITELLDYQLRKAWVLRGKRKVEVRAEEIKAGDTVIVYSGGMIPVDGRVIKGIATVDQKTITGESLPVERRTQDKVYAATVIRDGKLYVRAERVAGETIAAQIVRLVEGAPVGETRIQNYAEKFADRILQY